MSRSPRELCGHILEELDFLIERVGSVGREQFLCDETLRRAAARSLEIIGEAAKALPDDFRTQHRHVDWRGMAGMRDRLIHAYFGVDYELVWDVISTIASSTRDAVGAIRDA